MDEDDDLAPVPSRIRGISIFSDLLLPLAIASGPRVCFGAMGLFLDLFGNLEKQPEVFKTGLLVLFLAIEVIAIVWLAVLALMRYGRGIEDLGRCYPLGPPAWRSLSLFMGVCFLTLTDVLAAVANLPGALFLYAGALFTFLVYFLFIWLAFLGAGRTGAVS